MSTGSTKHTSVSKTSKVNPEPIGNTIIERIWSATESTPNKIALRYIYQTNGPAKEITYQQLQQMICDYSRSIRQLCQPEEVALLAMPDQLEFWFTLLGCIHAKVIPAPIPMGKTQAQRQRLQKIVQDSRAMAIFCLEKNQPEILKDICPEETSCNLPVYDITKSHAPSPVTPSSATKKSIAILQYTSGSTGSPKGIPITHDNILANCRYIADPENPEHNGFNWLPHFHDFGLICFGLAPLCNGDTTTHTPIELFLKKPAIWLQLIEKYRVTFAGVTPSAANLLVNLLENKEQDRDLSCLSQLLIAAEPITVDCLTRFSTFLSEFGVPPEALCPAYGLAEATVGVASVDKTVVWRSIPISNITARPDSLSAALEENDGCLSQIVSCGRPTFETRVSIIDPTTGKTLPDQHTGEIWVSGPTVTSGYWHDEDTSNTTFHGQIEGDRSPWLRTGDCGFINKGELFVTGRLKDLIIINGQNIFPQDIEETVSKACHNGKNKNDSAAFSIIHNGIECIIVVQELPKKTDCTELYITNILERIRDAHQIPIYDLVFIRKKSVHKTSSGKIQRSRTKAAYLDKSLDIIASSKGLQNQIKEEELPASPVESKLCNLWQEMLNIGQVGIHDNFFQLGGDSLLAIRLCQRIGQEFSVDVPVALLFQNPTIAALAQHIQQLDAAPQMQLPSAVPEPDHRFEPFPLNAIQQAYWLGRQSGFGLGQVATQSYLEWELDDIEQLDVPRLERAWQALVDRHDMLRTVILPSGEQQVLPEVPDFALAITDLCGLNDPATLTQRLLAIRQAESHRVSDPGQWPLFDCQLLRLPNQRGRLLFRMDALVADAGSSFLIFAELADRYQHPEVVYPPLQLTFRDYLLAVPENHPARLRDRAYWLERLDTLPPAPQLPVTTLVAEEQPRFVRRSGTLPSEHWQSLQNQARQQGLTTNAILLTAWSLVLARWCREPAMTLNLTTFQRLPVHGEVDRIIGDFTALSLLEVHPDPTLDFLSQAQRVQQQLSSDLSHRLFSGVEVLRALRQQAGADVLMPVVFTSTLGLDNQALDTLMDNQLFGTPGYAISQTPQVSLDHQVMEQNGALVYNWDAVEQLFDPTMLDSLFASWNALLQTLATGPECWKAPVSPSLPQPDLALWQALNNTGYAWPDDDRATLLTDILQQAEQRGEQPALISGDETLDYRTLLARAHSLASTMTGQGVQPGSPVAIYTEKSIGQVTAVLATLLAGAFYVPLNPEWPIARIKQVLAQLDQPVVMTDSEWASNLHSLAPDTVTTLLIEDGEPANHRIELPDTQPDDLAYVIFTSGSTGTPKGVMMSHRAVLNTIRDVNRRASLNAEDRVYGLSALSFDLSVWDIFGTFSAGATLVLPDSCLVKSPQHWRHQVAQHRVTVWNTVPALAELLIEEAPADDLGSLRLALLSGDWIPLTLPDRLREAAPGIHVLALGGATEAAIWSNCFTVAAIKKHWSSIPYGTPLANQQFYVLQPDSRQLCPPGVTGELCIGGAGLALGYLGDPQKTASAFIEHRDYGRLYRTGDLGHLDGEGLLIFEGRKDTQVKIHGHRVELGEIEATLKQQPGIKEAVATLRDGNLVAWVTSSDPIPDSASTTLTDSSDYSTRWQALCRRGDIHLPDTELAMRSKLFPNADPALSTGKLWQSAMNQADSIVTEVLYQLFTDLHLLQKPDEALTTEQMLSRGRIRPRYHRWFQRMLDFMERQHCLKHQAGQYSHCCHPANAHPDTTSLRGKMGDWQLPDANTLKRILQGDMPAIEIYATDYIEDTYQTTHLYRFHQARHILTTLMDEWQQKSDAPRRILEIGAGFGSLTQHIYPVISKHHCDYFFTDVSPFFFETAREHFPSERIHYALYDINLDPVLQGFKLYDFDLVLASNVLHIAAFIDQAMDNLKRLLKPGGHLLFIEYCQYQPAMDLIKGLQTGSDEQQDARDNPDNLLSVDQWIRHLNQHFPNTYHGQTEPVGISEAMGLHLFMAQQSNTIKILDIPRCLQEANQHLPGWMQPRALLPILCMPRLASGKTDRQRLSSYGLIDSRTLFTPPTTPDEARLCNLWQELLNIEQVGIHDNFFQLGGGSLLAIRLCQRIGQELSVNAPVALLFQHPTIARLAPELTRDIEPIPARHLNRAPMSFAQQSLWFIEQYEQGTAAYHIPWVFKLSGDQFCKRFIASVQQLVHRHKALRTYFMTTEDGEMIQQVHEQTLSVDHRQINNNELSSIIHKEINTPFDLTSQYPLRLLWLSADSTTPEKTDHYLLLLFHHIAVDAWSLEILSKELSQLLVAGSHTGNDTDASLLEPDIDFLDFSVWEQENLSLSLIQEQQRWWRHELDGLPPLQLPTDYPRPPQFDYRGHVKSFVISEELSDQLRNLARQEAVTIFSIMLSAFSLLLCRYSDTDDITIGTQVAARNHPQLKTLVGFLVHTAVIRTTITPDKGLSQLISDCHKKVTYINQLKELPFQHIVEALKTPRSTERNPLFQVMFNLQHFDYTEIHGAENIHYQKETTWFDLRLVIDDKPSCMIAQLDYATSCFKEETINYLWTNYIHILNRMVDNSDGKLSDIQLSSRKILQCPETDDHTLLSESDRKSLYIHEPPLSKASTALTPVQSKEIKEIWQSILSLPKDSINDHDSFFELGGSSLQALFMSKRIEKKLGMKLCLPSFFNNPTIKGIKYLICLSPPLSGINRF